ncbi:MAG: riboflavin synthase [Acidobacteria bacterium]|nr:riboflavin synthase [Acidobacteriota bacterium]
MFTGIVEETGRIAAIEPREAGARIRIECKRVLEDSTPGSSIAVNGVCLTAVDLAPDSFCADLAPETLRRTNLGDLAPGALVNLERPLSPSGRLSGHIVQGHVDGTAELLALDPLGADNWWLKARIPAELDRYLVFKGSVCLDGISLTIASIEDRVLGVTIVPHTIQVTNLRDRRPGGRINVECDILAKHVEKLFRLITPPPRS